MIIFGLFFLIALIVAAVAVGYAVTRTMHPASHVPVGVSSIDALLARWTAAGLMTNEQAVAIAEHETEVAAAGGPPRGAPGRADTAGLAHTAPEIVRRIPAVAEALGYLGGVLAVIGLVLIVVQYWPDMATAGRLALSGAGAVGLLVAGFLARPDGDAAMERLRGFVWLASTACTGLFAGVLAAEVFDAGAAETITLAISAAAAAQSGLIWRRHDLPFQQLTLFGAIVVLAGSLVALLVPETVPIGLAVWAVGGALLVVGVRRLAPIPAVGEVVGGVSMAVGALITVDAWEPASLFGTGTAGLLLALALVPGLAPERSDQVPLGLIGLSTSVAAVSVTIGYFAQDAGVITGLVTSIAGASLLYLEIREVVRIPLVVETVGAIAILVGAAVTAAQFLGFAPVFGIATAIGLLAAGMLPRQGVLSLVGSAGLLINVLWLINHFFSGEGQAPVMTLVTGALILVIAVVLSRSGKVRRDLSAAGRG